MELRQQIRGFALGLPEAWEDFPWDESVVKVGKKVFVFLGSEPSTSSAMTVKLADSHEQALAVPGAVPSGYGLGKWGWVSVPLHGDVPPVAVLTDWVTESYQLVAPKRLADRINYGD